ncbi:MAG: Microcompartments protein [Caldanaerobacter subterraneus]|jgi:microcompartment protein PduB|uniref:Propanediol utilization microcompartment protein PduB n=1 Tax=Caldanaerobacter subterraneus TaxID=911092 RepID=A0A101E4H7_9THEO|nr:propanediol utilization microcompartment protein PduB [Caldanaerobacter subterraneus]KUK08683.1 MAG: Microcompartments protein [Caldanaerobacter subterraneus]HBT49845.1 propanediol utilization microcompartment protein PduB [Caldanaerobacter subterraneus]
MDEQVIRKIVEDVVTKVSKTQGEESKSVGGPAITNPGLTEFVGTAIGDTIGLVIANVDASLHEKMGIDPKYRSIGIIGGRTGAGPQIMAADEAVKATNTEVVAIELPRDTKGGAGHGSLIIFGAEEVSDARRAVEVALKELNRTFGDVYANDAGHLEFQYTARASYALQKAFGAPLGKAFGLIVGAPAAIGVVCCDTAVKAAEVEIIGYASPAKGTSLTNEAILFISGDSGAVRQAIIAAREVGLKLLSTLGEVPKSVSGEPYI